MLRASNKASQFARIEGGVKGLKGHGIGKVHCMPAVELKCVSEKRRGEIAALVERTKTAGAAKIAGLCRLPTPIST